MQQESTLPERHLIAELAVGLARRMFSILDGQDHIIYPEPGYVWHMATSDFEDGCNVLWHLDAAVAAYASGQGPKNLTVRDNRTEKGWPPYFKFLTANEIRLRILSGPPKKAPDLDEILSAYLGVMCNYGRSDTALSSEREPFVAPRQYEREIEALERLGYVERRRESIIWTDRIAPAMRNRQLWGSEDLPINLEANLRLIIATQALSRLSDADRSAAEKKANHMTKEEFALFSQLEFDELWFRNPDGRRKSVRDADALIEAVYAILTDRRSD